MQIQTVKIENYTCLKQVLINFGNFTVLVGKNGSGKTSILEAIHRFFTDFAATGGGVSAGSSDYLWYDRVPNNPISIHVDLTVSPEEYEKLLPEPSKELLENIKLQFGPDCFKISACRQIATPGAAWRTGYLKLADIPLVKDDKIINLPEFSKLLVTSKAMERFVFHYFTPQKLSGDRLLVDMDKKVAYLTAPNIDALASAGELKSSSEGEGQNYKEWATQKGFELMERPPQASEVSFLLQPITAEVLNVLITNLANTMHGKFRFIPAARDNKIPAGTARTSIIDQPTLDSMRALSLSIQRPDELKWDKFRNWVVKFIGKDIEPNPTGLLIRDMDLRIPVPFLGGGEQGLFGLLWSLAETGFIIAIEEPENHFHPEYVRKLLAFFKDFASDGIQTILCTHSPLLIDKVQVSNNWVIRRTAKETTAEQLRERDDLKLVLSELGVVPSDIYLKDFVLFVEGGTEREAVLPIFAQKLGFPLLEHVAVISIGGDSKLKDYLRMWLNLLGFAPLDYLILLDGHSKELVYELARDFNIDINKFKVLSKHGIEDYYPGRLIVSALKDLFGITVTELQVNGSKEKDNFIKSVLDKEKKMRNRWKIDIGEYVAEQMSSSEIPAEIKEALNTIRETLKLP
ncbi:MAG: hypothetical protein A2Z28_04755 [Chloroflexi bacterium RBG_16_51_9]|nr:MAG: hypothetical protein A2Z28_04755 [Chloroflexi bacterium RBG_16_51_9]